MFDTMTMTKAVGAICGSLLVFLLVGWAGNSLFTVGGAHKGGHEGEEIAQAYSIDTGTEEVPAEGAEEGPDFATLLASAEASSVAKSGPSSAPSAGASSAPVSIE